MPYIKKARREFLQSAIPGNSGELNYLLFTTCKNYLIYHGFVYETMNEIIGVLESCKQEFYRRVVVPYEEKKIKENGDVL